MRANHRGADVINSSKAAPDINVGTAATQVCVRTLQRVDERATASAGDRPHKTTMHQRPPKSRRAIKDDTTLA